MKPELSALHREECPDCLARAQVRADSSEWARTAAGLVSRSICNMLQAGQVLRRKGQIVAVCKSLLHLGQDHGYWAMKAQCRKSSPIAFEDRCWSRRGNGLQYGVWVYLTGQALFRKYRRNRLPTAGDVAGPAVVPLQQAKLFGYICSKPVTSAQAWRERSPDYHLLLARLHGGFQLHRGSLARREASSLLQKPLLGKQLPQDQQLRLRLAALT